MKIESSNAENEWQMINKELKEYFNDPKTIADMIAKENSKSLYKNLLEQGPFQGITGTTKFWEEEPKETAPRKITTEESKQEKQKIVDELESGFAKAMCNPIDKELI